MFPNLLKIILMITVPRTSIPTRLTLMEIKSVMFVITARIIIILTKKTQIRMQQGMYVMQMMTTTVMVSI